MEMIELLQIGLGADYGMPSSIYPKEYLIGCETKEERMRRKHYELKRMQIIYDCKSTMSERATKLRELEKNRVTVKDFDCGPSIKLTEILEKCNG